MLLMDSPQWGLPQRYEDTSTDDCMKQSVGTEFITVRSPAAQTTSSLSSTLTLQEGRKHVQRRKTNVFFSSEQIKIWSSSPPEEAIWMWKENRGQLWMCVWFHKATGGIWSHWAACWVSSRCAVQTQSINAALFALFLTHCGALMSTSAPRGGGQRALQGSIMDGTPPHRSLTITNLKYLISQIYYTIFLLLMLYISTALHWFGSWVRVFEQECFTHFSVLSLTP